MMNEFDKLHARVDRYAEWARAGFTPAIFDAVLEILDYAKELADTDYRGNPPAEHFIAKRLCAIIERCLADKTIHPALCKHENKTSYPCRTQACLTVDWYCLDCSYAMGHAHSGARHYVTMQKADNS